MIFDWPWYEILIWIAILVINGRIAIELHLWSNKRRTMKFLHMLEIQNPDAQTMRYISCASTDEEALRKLETQFKEGQHV